MTTTFAQAAREYHDTGATIVRQALSPGETAELRRQLDRYIRDIIPTHTDKDVFYEDPAPAPATAITPATGSGTSPESNSTARTLKSAFRLNQREPYFDQLIRHPTLAAIVLAIFPDGEILSDGGVMYFAKSPRDGSVTPPHQDNAFQNWVPPLALTLTLAVDRSTPENGALTINRGSHALGLLPHRQSGVLGFSRCLIDPINQAAYPPIQLCMHPGDVALHHINAVHFSGANHSAHPRRQIGIAYRSSLAQRDAAAFEQYQRGVDALLGKPGRVG